MYHILLVCLLWFTKLGHGRPGCLCSIDMMKRKPFDVFLDIVYLYNVHFLFFMVVEATHNLL